MLLRLNSSDLLLPLESFNTEDIFIIISGPSKVIFHMWAGADRHFCVNVKLASLHYDQNCPSSVPKTLQSWCRALRDFYRTSLLPLCNAFCHVYEKSLKRLEIDNISSVSKHEPKSNVKFLHFHPQMDGY